LVTIVTTAFDSAVDSLQGRIAALPNSMRGVVLLALAERYAKVFELFARNANLTGRFRGVLDSLWQWATSGVADDSVAGHLESLIPLENTVTDGFHDALAQYIGGAAHGAMLEFRGAADRGDQYAPGLLDALRILLSEARLASLERGEDNAGLAFDRELHNDPIVVAELKNWDALLELAYDSASADRLRGEAERTAFDPSVLEPELSDGLEADMS
jgi:hypothetical protein